MVLDHSTPVQFFTELLKFTIPERNRLQKLPNVSLLNVFSEDASVHLHLASEKCHINAKTSSNVCVR